MTESAKASAALSRRCLQNLLVEKAGVKKKDLFDQIHRLSLGYYAEHEAGNVMSRLTNDTDTIQQALGFALLQVVSGALLIVWIVIKMLSRFSMPPGKNFLPWMMRSVGPGHESGVSARVCVSTV